MPRQGATRRRPPLRLIELDVCVPALGFLVITGMQQLWVSEIEVIRTVPSRVATANLERVSLSDVRAVSRSW